jgi:hypothetical protein
MDLAAAAIGFSKRAVGRGTMTALAAMSNPGIIRAGGRALAPHAMRGAMIGAGAGAAMSFGSGVLNGDLSFGGVVGGAFRGAMMGGIGNAGFRGIRALGRQQAPGLFNSQVANPARMLNWSGMNGANMGRAGMWANAKKLNFTGMGGAMRGGAMRWAGVGAPKTGLAGGAAFMRMGG